MLKKYELLSQQVNTVTGDVTIEVLLEIGVSVTMDTSSVNNALSGADLAVRILGDGHYIPMPSLIKGAEIIFSLQLTRSSSNSPLLLQDERLAQAYLPFICHLFEVTTGKLIQHKMLAGYDFFFFFQLGSA